MIEYDGSERSYRAICRHLAKGSLYGKVVPFPEPTQLCPNDPGKVWVLTNGGYVLRDKADVPGLYLET